MRPSANASRPWKGCSKPTNPPSIHSACAEDCGRGAGGKTIVFGLLKHDDRVYTATVPNASKAALQAVIRGRVSLKSVVHPDGWAGYHGLVDLGYDKHLRVEHRENIFARQPNHINGIESLWSLAKRHLSKFCGVPKRTFYLHLKETEFRFNHRNHNLYKEPLDFLRKDPLSVLCFLSPFTNVSRFKSEQLSAVQPSVWDDLTTISVQGIRQ